MENVPDREIKYMKTKAKLSSIYGMMAQDPVKQSNREDMRNLPLPLRFNSKNKEKNHGNY